MIRESLFHFLGHCGFGCGTSPFSSFIKNSTFHISSSFVREKQTVQVDYSHIYLHTMGDREDEIPEMSSLPQEVGDVDSTPIYDHSHFGYDPSFVGRRYWFPSDETHHEPTSTSHVLSKPQFSKKFKIFKITYNLIKWSH